MIRAIAIDDEPLPLEILSKYCSLSTEIVLEKAFTKITQANEFLSANHVDLVFLDIQMPHVSGIEFCKSLPPGTMVVFTTAYSRYAVEGFNLKAVDYLLKPYSFERFEAAVKKAGEQIQLFRSEAKDYIFLRIEYSLVKVNLDEIIFIESFGDYLNIHTEGNDEPLKLRMTMLSILEKLPAGRFIRVHRSYIVALKFIDKVRNRIIYIAGKEIPIGSSFDPDLSNL